jgi:hypothetical protein
MNPMDDQYPPPKAVGGDGAEPLPHPARPLLLWLSCAYSVVVSLFQFVMAVRVFSENTQAIASVPFYVHYIAYVVPTLLLAAGILLFRLSKLAVLFYATYAVAFFVDPLILAYAFASPHARTRWLEPYAALVTNPEALINGVIALGLTGYSLFLYRRGKVK